MEGADDARGPDRSCSWRKSANSVVAGQAGGCGRLEAIARAKLRSDLVSSLDRVGQMEKEIRQLRRRSFSGCFLCSDKPL